MITVGEHYVITVCVCRHCGALVDAELLDVHVKWHANTDPVKAFQEHWRRT